MGMAARRNVGRSQAARIGAALNTPAGIAQLRNLEYSLIVDMDDTLISNQAHFDDATDALLGIFYRLDDAGRPKAVLRALHDEIEATLLPSLGYTPERWFASARRTAELVAGRELTGVEQAEVRRAAGIAMHDGEILPGTEDALTACREAGVKMILKTKGQREKQQQKLAAHRFDRFFGEQIWVVERKDVDSFRMAVEHYGLRNPVSLGDSLRSDIAPARAAGIDAIHLQSGGIVPDFERNGGEMPEGAMSAPSFPEGVQLLLDLQALAVARSL